MRTLALLAFLGCAAVAQAQPPKTYAPETAPRPNEETVLNARVVSVDVAGARLTVRGVDVKADGGRDETFSVAAPAASRLSEFKRGMEVLLVLRGTTVVDVKSSVASGAAATRGTGTAGPSSHGRARATAGTTTGTTAVVTDVPETGTTAPMAGAAVPMIPEGVVPLPGNAPGSAQPAVVAPEGTVMPGKTVAPNARPTPSMIGVAPGSGSARTNAQGAITLTGSPEPASPAPRASARPVPRRTVTPAPRVTPQPGVTPQPAPQTGPVSPQPVPGGPVTGAAGGRIIPGPITPGPITPGVVTPGTVGVITSTPSPAAYGTPFPTPRPQPTPIPVGAPPPVGTPKPVLVPSNAPPSPATSPATSPAP
jgi:hypothetical protein